jgi:crotonobetainyl-CoA:carnitine CoA-transferase CaiB-like acyl-CoA transferase
VPWPVCGGRASEAVASLVQYMRTQYFGTPAQRTGGVGPPMLACADGFLFFNYLLEMNREPLLLALGLTKDDLPERREDLGAFLAERTRTRKASELAQSLGMVGATCATTQDTMQLLSNEHLVARDFFKELTTPAGKLTLPGPSARMSLTPAVAPEPPQPFQGWLRRPHAEGRARAPRNGPRLPLAGIRIVDLTQAWIGPYATMLLADLGAEVIKVESPTRPDVWRNVSELPPCARPGAHRWNTCHFFNSVNRNKRSLALDLDKARGRELFLKLVQDADLLMENYTPRVMDNFGLGFDVLHALNPRLVMVSFSGYGASGPCATAKPRAPPSKRCVAGLRYTAIPTGRR